MRTLTALSLPITTFATLLAVVACGPSKDYVTVRQQPRSALSQAVDSCQSTIKASTKRVEENKTVKFCRIPDSATVDRTKEMRPELVEQEYYFEITRKSEGKASSDQLSIELNVGLQLPEGLTEPQQKQVLDQLQSACTPFMQNVFGRSVRGLNLEFNPSFKVIEASSSVPNPMKPAKTFNKLTLLKIENGTKYPAYEMQAFANGAKFYPLGESSEMARCGSISGGEEAQSDCRGNSFVATNQKFCRQLTKMTGIWLGLSDEPTERVACGLPAEEATPAATPTLDVAGAAKPAEAPKKPAKSKFMKAASEEDPKKFFESTKLDLSELSTILTPACPAFATITEPTPRPASNKKSPGARVALKEK